VVLSLWVGGSILANLLWSKIDTEEMVIETGASLNNHLFDIRLNR
jgi:hypothetical protein